MYNSQQSKFQIPPFATEFYQGDSINLFVDMQELGLDGLMEFQCSKNLLVNELKQAVQEQIQNRMLPNIKWWLTYNDKLLEDNKRIINYNLSNDCKLQVATSKQFSEKNNLETIKIIVLSVTGNSFEIFLSPSCLVYSIKKEVSGLTNIPDEKLTLIYSGKQLEDHRSLADYKIIEGSKIHLLLQLRGGCFPDNTPITLSNGMIKNISQIKKGDFILSYDTNLHLFISSEVTDTHRQQCNCLIKILIGNTEIICTPNHPFLTKKGWKANQVLDVKYQYNLINLIEYLIGEQQQVYNITVRKTHTYLVFGFVVHNMDIYIRTLDGKSFTLNLDCDDMIIDLQRKLFQQHGISIGQRLIFSGKQIDSYHHTLSYYKIQKESTIHLLQLQKKHKKIEILLRNEYFHFLMEQDATLMSVKKLVALLKHNEAYNNYYVKIKQKGTFIEIISPTDQIPDECSILFVEPEAGANALQIMSQLSLLKNYDLTDLRQTLNSINQKYEMFIESQILTINQSQEKKALYQQFSLENLLAIGLWTSDYIYRDLNYDLRKNSICRWQKYLKCFFDGLKQCSYYEGSGFRGVSKYRDNQLYRKNKRILWNEISSVSKNRDIATYYSDNEGMLFEIDIVSAKDISKKLSLFENEEELVLPLFLSFLVEQVTEYPNAPILVKLKEIPYPTYTKVLLWVDDEPSNNYVYVQDLEKELLGQRIQISVVFCRSTEEALEIIKSFYWMIYLEPQNFRVVSDMVRFEKGKTNYYAGIDLLKSLFQHFKLDQDFLLFCGNTENAIKNCKDQKLVGNYLITSRVDELMKFIRFK